MRCLPSTVPRSKLPHLSERVASAVVVLLRAALAVQEAVQPLVPLWHSSVCDGARLLAAAGAGWTRDMALMEEGCLCRPRDAG